MGFSSRGIVGFSGARIGFRDRGQRPGSNQGMGCRLEGQEWVWGMWTQGDGVKGARRASALRSRAGSGLGVKTGLRNRMGRFWVSGWLCTLGVEWLRAHSVCWHGAVDRCCQHTNSVKVQFDTAPGGQQLTQCVGGEESGWTRK